MSNDRIYIRCKFCKEQIMLSKYYPSCALGLWHSSETYGDWLELHRHCRPRPRAMFLDGDPGFEFVTESDPPAP